MSGCPRICSLHPVKITLEAGTHWWCSCGLSGHQPFCDGEHTGTGMGPKKIVVAECAEVSLCNCKQTQTPPFCDGSHLRLSEAPQSSLSDTTTLTDGFIEGDGDGRG